jgi:hypothetical protein
MSFFVPQNDISLEFESYFDFFSKILGRKVGASFSSPAKCHFFPENDISYTKQVTTNRKNERKKFLFSSPKIKIKYDICKNISP